MCGWVTKKRLALIGGLILFAIALWQWHADAAIATWVQAAFSVLAIVAAIWVAEMQADRQRLLEASRERAGQVKRLEAIQAICKHAAQLLHDVSARRADKGYIDKPQVRRVEVSQLEDARIALASIPLHDVAPWQVAEAVLTLLRSTGDVREAITNTPSLTSSWTTQRGELFRVNAGLANKACASIRDALRSVGVREAQPAGTTSVSESPVPDMAPLVDAVYAPDSGVSGEPTLVHVQFSDDTQRDIVSYFGGPQDPKVYANLATIHSSDARYHVWYYAQPEMMRQALPVPTRAG